MSEQGACGLEQVVSSAGLGWQGIEVERQRYPGGEYTTPALHQHSLGFHLHPRPLWMEQVRAGQQQVITLQQHDLVLIPAGMDNLCRHPDGGDELFVRLEPRFVSDIAEQIGVGSGIEVENVWHAEDNHLWQIAVQLLGEAENPGLGGGLYVESLANQLAVSLLRRFAPVRPTSTTPANLRRALAYIHDQLAESLTLEAIAAEAYLSPFHFTRVFKQAMGLAPHQYVIQQRVERAKTLLQHTPHSTAEIAAMVGFADYSHLTRHFKRLVGASPTTYRKNVQN